MLDSLLNRWFNYFYYSDVKLIRKKKFFLRYKCMYYPPKKLELHNL
jgi:hypothetical protein